MGEQSAGAGRKRAVEKVGYVAAHESQRESVKAQDHADAIQEDCVRADPDKDD